MGPSVSSVNAVGASEVIAFSLEDPETSGFNRLKSVLGSKVRYVTGSVYNLQDYNLGQFDVVSSWECSTIFDIHFWR